MQRRSALALVMLAVASSASFGCASADEAPPAFVNVDDADEATQLAALDIASDEPVIDEGNFESDSAELAANTLDEDEEEAPALRTLSVTPSGEQVAKLADRRWACPGGQADCKCVGSKLNCEFPNGAQPGRDRYLPPAFLAELQKRNVKLDEVFDAGAWATTPTFDLYDGQGISRGNYKRPCYAFAGPAGAALTEDKSKICVRVNFGQMKDMQVAGEAAPKRFVYAMTGAARGVPASGWVPLDAVVDKANLVKMGSHAARVVRSLAKTSYVVKAAEDWNQSPQTYDHELLPAWTKATLGKASKHVIPQAGDYLLRTGNVINLIYSTPGAGGASTDTFVVEKDRLAFARAKSTAARPTLVRVGVADPKRKSMVFAYGSIAGRFGWLALDAIKSGNVVSVAAPRAEVASGTPSVCDGKPNGTACSDVFPNEAHTCRDGQLIESLACPPPQTHCVGVSADAQIICAE